MVCIFIFFNCSYSSGKLVDCNKRDLLITSDGLNNVFIGDPYKIVLNKFPNAVEFIEWAEGIENKNLKFEDACGYIIFRFDYGLLTEIRTNNQRIRTKLGLHIGDSLGAIKSKGEILEEFEALGGELIIALSKTEIKFRIKNEQEKQYFKDGGDFEINLKDHYTIEEFIIRKSNLH